MNIFELLTMSVRIYALRILNYLYASIAYALSLVVASGVAVAFLILDGILALLAGEGGVWIQSPIFALAIFASSVFGVFCFFYIYFAAAGAYMQTCAKIGAGQKDTGTSQYVEYMVKNAHSFFAIAIIPNIITLIIGGALVAGGILLSQFSLVALWISFALASMVWFFVQAPFWFSFAAKVVEQKRSFEAIRSSLYIMLKKPFASLLLIFIIYLLAVLPAVSVFFYPIYFFVFLSPFASILTIGFYEVQKGLLR